MRFSLKEKEVSLFEEILIEFCTTDMSSNKREVVYNLLNQVTHERYKGISSKQKDAAIKATKVRVSKAKNKIENAINMLRLRNIEITTYTVSKESGCSFNTCKKYKEFWEK